MPYTAPTLAQARAELAGRLNDPDMVHWLSGELDLYIREAIRVWQAWTAHWRARETFQTTQLQPFYDLGVVLDDLRPMTVTNLDLITEIEYMLLEPPTPTQWTGTDQFTLEKVAAAVENRRDRFLQLTGAVVTRTLAAYAAPADGRLALPEAVLTLRRVCWRPSDTAFLQVLRRTDEFAADHFATAWPTAAIPVGYSTAAAPPLSLQVLPPPSVNGQLDYVSINKGASLTADLTAEVVLGVPDDWAWVVKYGALADLLSADGLALDPVRAQYCEARWEQGISMAQSASVVLSARIAGPGGDAGAVVPIASVSDADSYTPLWQLLAGVPAAVALMGQNLLATVPVANADGYVVSLDVVRNAPVPAVDGDVIELSADLVDTILDLAQAAATFKEGPGQNQSAQALFQRAAGDAGLDLAIQQAAQPSRSPLLLQQRQDELALPRTVAPVEIP